MSLSQRSSFVLAGLLIAAGLGSGDALLHWERHAQAGPARAAAAQAETLPDFSFADLQGRRHDSSEWKSNILVLNFWAPWCPPCRAEIPGFIRLQRTFHNQNVRFVGIAVDHAKPVQDFVRRYGVDYPILLGGQSAIDLSIRLGDHLQGLPFTIVALPGGKVILQHTGELSEQRLAQVLDRAVGSHPSVTLTGNNP